MAGPDTTPDLSLLGEQGSPVRTYIPAGAWPSGPTRAYNTTLAPVDLAAGEGSIFRRRFARPGNRLARLLQAEFQLPPSTPDEAPAWGRSTAGTPSPAADSPLPPPTAVRARLQDLSACDASLRGPVLEAARLLGRLRQDLAPPWEPRARAAQEARAARCRAQLLDRLGMPCCRPGMRLIGDWVPSCLRGPAERSLWAATWGPLHGAARGEPEGVWCPWPDCRAAMPLWCCYENPAGEARWRCVACGGNSMCQAYGFRPAR